MAVKTQPIISSNFVMQKMPGKGGWTYVVLPAIPKELRGPGNGVKVNGFIDDYELHGCNLMPIKGGGLFLPVKLEIRKIIKKEAGDTVSIVFHLEQPVALTDPRNEIMVCLEDEPAARKTFLCCNSEQQELMIDWIRQARNDDTRINRIAKAIDRLAMGWGVEKVIS